MAYSEFLADRIRQRLNHKGPVIEKKMMGGLIFKVNEKMCIGIDIDKDTDMDFWVRKALEFNEMIVKK